MGQGLIFLALWQWQDFNAWIYFVKLREKKLTKEWGYQKGNDVFALMNIDCELNGQFSLWLHSQSNHSIYSLSMSHLLASNINYKSAGIKYQLQLSENTCSDLAAIRGVQFSQLVNWICWLLVRSEWWYYLTISRTFFKHWKYFYRNKEIWFGEMLFCS